MTSFDYEQVDADIARVLAFGTPAFEHDFRSAMGADFVDRIVANKRTSIGQVVSGPSVVTAGSDFTTFVVLLDQAIAVDGAEEAPQVVRVGLLVTVDADADPRVTGVQLL